MIANKNNNPVIEEFDINITEFEQKIEEDRYDSIQDGFEDEFNKLKEDAQALYNECYDENEIKIVDSFINTLNMISDEQDLYNEEAERNFMFPNRTANSDSDGDLDEGFSTDKYFVLD